MKACSIVERSGAERKSGRSGTGRPRCSSASSKLKGWSSTSQARPRIGAATSRLSSAAEEPLRKISTFSESSTRLRNCSHPGTSWISSRQKVTVSCWRSAG